MVQAYRSDKPRLGRNSFMETAQTRFIAAVADVAACAEIALHAVS